MEHDRRGRGIFIFMYFNDTQCIYYGFIFQGNPHLSCFDQLKFLVLDEADRMVERGHFTELKDILHRINGQPLCDGHRRQKLVFSATLTLPKKRRKKDRKSGRQESQDAGIGAHIITVELQCIILFLLLFVGELMSLVGLADDASVVDLTSRHVTVNTLTETRINCTTEQKVVRETC